MNDKEKEALPNLPLPIHMTFINMGKKSREVVDLEKSILPISIFFSLSCNVVVPMINNTPLINNAHISQCRYVNG